MVQTLRRMVCPKCSKSVKWMKEHNLPLDMRKEFFRAGYITENYVDYCCQKCGNVVRVRRKYRD